jgi:porphyrinogen peroxidase
MRCRPRRRNASSDIEIDETIRPAYAHNSLNTIIEDGKEIKIVRDNMPFGRAGQGEFGTYFIGYSRSPRTIEQMLENMFVGRPPGNYDRVLNFSRAVTGNLFFVPSATFLDEVTPDAAPEPSALASADEPSQSTLPALDGSLGIGSLKGKPRS